MIPAVRGSPGPNRLRARSSASRNSGSASAPRPARSRRPARSIVKSMVNVPSGPWIFR